MLSQNQRAIRNERPLVVKFMNGHGGGRSGRLVARYIDGYGAPVNISLLGRDVGIEH